MNWGAKVFFFIGQHFLLKKGLDKKIKKKQFVPKAIMF
jgi:hypothetical protein